MRNEYAILFTLVMSLTLTMAIFLGKLLAVALRMDGKREVLREYLDENYPTIKYAIAAVVLIFMCSIQSSLKKFIVMGLLFFFWRLTYLIPYYVCFWEPERIKTSEELKEEYGERLCPYCNKPLEIINDAYICMSEGCEYKYELAELPENKKEDGDILGRFYLWLFNKALVLFSFLLACILMKCVCIMVLQIIRHFINI